jgi:hypothetical protein
LFRFPDATDLEAQAVAASKKLVPPSAAARSEVTLAIAAVRWLRQLTEARRKTYMRHHSARKQVDLHRYFLVLVVAFHFARWARTHPTTSVEGPWITFLAALLNHCEDRKKELTHEGARKLWNDARRWRAAMVGD